MDRYDGATASATPDALPAAVATGHFSSGVPGTKPRTVMEGWFMDGLVEEIRNAIIAGGITPNRAVYTQLRDAIIALAGNAVPFASYSDVQAGTSSSKAVTPASLTGGISLGTNWYYKLPGGFILQGGVFPMGAGGSNTETGTITLPIAFPNNFFGIAGNADKIATSGFGAVVVVFPIAGRTLSQAPVLIDSTNPTTALQAGIAVEYIAFGN